MTPPGGRRIVVDTDVASFILKEDPLRAPRYLQHISGGSLVIPFSVLAELFYGAEERRWGAERVRRMQAFVARCQTVFPDEAICTMWSHLRVVAKRAGRIVERQDAWVAAVALHLEAPPLTHNAKHFAGIPLLRVITEPDT